MKNEGKINAIAYYLDTQRQKSKCKEKQNYLWLVASKELEISGQINFQGDFN